MRMAGAQKFTKTVAGHVVVASATPIKFFTTVCYNGTGGNIWLQVFDAAAEPAGGTVPTFPPLVIASGDTRFYDFYDYGRPMATGVVVATSSTAGIYTATADSNFIDVGVG